jgi:pimeloyl-ACP methyl ester carboxylesterase
MAAVFWIQPKFALTIASQLENLPESAARVGELNKFCDKPVVILSAGDAPEHRRKEHVSMARRLPLGEHVVARESNHWIMQEEPELVIGAIEKVVRYSQSARAASVLTRREQAVADSVAMRRIGKAAS